MIRNYAFVIDIQTIDIANGVPKVVTYGDINNQAIITSIQLKDSAGSPIINVDYTQNTDFQSITLQSLSDDYVNASIMLTGGRVGLTPQVLSIVARSER